MNKSTIRVNYLCRLPASFLMKPTNKNSTAVKLLCLWRDLVYFCVSRMLCVGQLAGRHQEHGALGVTQLALVRWVNVRLAMALLLALMAHV